MVQKEWGAAAEKCGGSVAIDRVIMENGFWFLVTFTDRDGGVSILGQARRPFLAFQDAKAVVDINVLLMKSLAGIDKSDAAKARKPAVSPKQPLTVACPVCQSPAGTPCVRRPAAMNIASWSGEMHVDRIKKAQEI